MAIDFKQFDELFAPAHQLTYISLGGHIDVGPNTYSVFHAYTMEERQIIFQVCQKYLPWQITEEQEQWERTMYVYQYIIKSPAPFPYPQYPLSEEIIMAITWEVTIKPLNVSEKEASVMAIRTDGTNPLDILTETHFIISAILNTTQQKVDVLDNIWQQHLDYQARQTAINNYIGTMETDAKSNLEGRES